MKVVSFSLLYLVLLRSIHSLKITKAMLPKPYRHPCDPLNEGYPEKCEKNKAELRLQRVNSRHDFFCRVYNICIEYSRGTIMLNVHNYWRAHNIVPRRKVLGFPADEIHGIVRHWNGADRNKNPYWWQPHHNQKVTAEDEEAKKKKELSIVEGGIDEGLENKENKNEDKLEEAESTESEGTKQVEETKD